MHVLGEAALSLDLVGCSGSFIYFQQALVVELLFGFR